MSRAFRLGVFIFAALLFFAGAVFLIGNKQFLFSSTYRLNSEFQNVAGLADGAEVRVGGLHEGTVKHIVLPDRSGGKVKVVMDLENATGRVIKKDSVASIAAEGLVGDKYVEISFGSDAAERVKDGDTISSEPPVDVSAVVKKADAMLDTARGAVQTLDATANNLKSISSKIDQGKGTVGALINDKGLYQRVNAGTTAFQEDMEALKHNFLLRGFFRNRGYEDSTELTKYEIPSLPAGPPSQRFAYDAQKLFDKPDSARLKNQKLLGDAGKYLQENSFGLAVVAAYTGMKGDSDKERTLTEARAMVVREHLVENFKLDDTRIKTLGLGKTNTPEEAGKLQIIVYPAAARTGQASRTAK
jgi:phospholipid/cholesterol/gamma-HCH transport system substrate-binding protein